MAYCAQKPPLGLLQPGCSWYGASKENLPLRSAETHYCVMWCQTMVSPAPEEGTTQDVVQEVENQGQILWGLCATEWDGPEWGGISPEED